MEQIKYELKQRQTEKEMQDCTFQPRLNAEYDYSNERNRDFYEGVPNGYKVKIINQIELLESCRKNAHR
jgi:hypothetical protein